MTDRLVPSSCDVIVLGGGDNGLLCAAYLANAGAATLLLDFHPARDPIGNLRTQEYQGPYHFNLLPPYWLAMAERAPCHIDLNLGQQSLAYVTPAVQMAFHHTDGRALVFHRDPRKTAASIARFSAADAERFLSLHDEFRLLCEEILIPALYAPDGHTGVAAQRSATPLGARLAKRSAQSPVEIVDDFGFESPQVREAILYLATFWGLDPREAGIGQVAVLWTYSLLNSSIPKAGNAAAARALYQTFLQQGGKYASSAQAARILVEGKRALGVVLNDGFEVRARAVVSTLSGPETFLDLVGEAELSDDLVQTCRDWEWQESSLLTCHYGYKGEAPTYYSAQFDADANNAYIHIFGVENTGDVENIYRAIAKGEIVEDHGRAICATQFDEFHAGFGQMNRTLQTLRFETPAPSRLAGREWADVGKSHRESALALWRRYATGVVDGTLSYSSIVTPPELQRRLPSFRQASFLGGKYTARRMGYACVTPACSQYRSEIGSLFMGGATTHPGGLGHFAAGYNAAGLVASSLGLRGRWDEPAFVRAARENGYLPGAGGQSGRN